MTTLNTKLRFKDTILDVKDILFVIPIDEKAILIQLKDDTDAQITCDNKKERNRLINHYNKLHKTICCGQLLSN